MRRLRSIRMVAAALGVALAGSGVALAAPAGATSSAPAGAAITAPLDIVDTAAGAGQFTTLLAAAEAAGLVDALRGDGPLTVFAPTDQAFDNLLRFFNTTPAAVLADTATLTRLLTYHVVAGSVPSSAIAPYAAATTLAGPPILAIRGTNGVTVNGSARVITADIAASNGIIHVIDAVLLPPPAV